MQRSTVSRTSFGRIANTLAGSTPGLIVPIARIFVVGVDVFMGCAYPEFGPKRLRISIRPAERACFIYLLHNVRRLVAQSLLLKQTVASSQASTGPEVLLSASKSTEPDGLEVGNDNFGVDVESGWERFRRAKRANYVELLSRGVFVRYSLTTLERIRRNCMRVHLY